jgi:hypothetical protein
MLLSFGRAGRRTLLSFGRSRASGGLVATAPLPGAPMPRASPLKPPGASSARDAARDSNDPAARVKAMCMRHPGKGGLLCVTMLLLCVATRLPLRVRCGDRAFKPGFTSGLTAPWSLHRTARSLLARARKRMRQRQRPAPFGPRKRGSTWRRP